MRESFQTFVDSCTRSLFCLKVFWTYKLLILLFMSNILYAADIDLGLEQIHSQSSTVLSSKIIGMFNLPLAAWIQQISPKCKRHRPSWAPEFAGILEGLCRSLTLYMRAFLSRNGCQAFSREWFQSYKPLPPAFKGLV